MFPLLAGQMFRRLRKPVVQNIWVIISLSRPHNELFLLCSKRHDSLKSRRIIGEKNNSVMYNSTPYNEVSRYREKCPLWWGLRYSEDPVITNYLVNNKNIRYSGVTKLTDLRVNSYIRIKQSCKGQSFSILTNRSRVWRVSHICIIMSFLLTASDRT